MKAASPTEPRPKTAVSYKTTPEYKQRLARRNGIDITNGAGEKNSMPVTPPNKPRIFLAEKGEFQ